MNGFKGEQLDFEKSFPMKVANKFTLNATDNNSGNWDANAAYCMLSDLETFSKLVISVSFKNNLKIRV